VQVADEQDCIVSGWKLDACSHAAIEVIEVEPAGAANRR
jgi:hypothetical protein